MNHPGRPPYQASLAETDSLLQTLLWVCNSYGIEKSAVSFLAGLPSMDRLSVEHGIRAMQAVGFDVKLTKRDPASFVNELMPIVLLEQDARALVLLRVLPSRRGLPLQFEVLEPGINAAPRVIDAAELYARYEGHCLLFKLLPKAGAAGGESDEAPSGSNWLWRTVWHYRRYYYL